MNSIIEIFKNANKFAVYDINGKKCSKINFNYFFFSIFPWLFSLFIVCVSRDNFNFEFTTIGALLSLFTGLLFNLLLKISDKVRQIPSKKSVKSENEIDKRTQETNYLKLFFYFLSYSIVVALILITLLIIQTFLSELFKIKLSTFIFTREINLSNLFCFFKVLCVLVYRFLVVFCLINFVMYILLSISYLYQYINFEFSKIE
ncbi:hypothetical protein J2Q11_05700 [Tenacibaculum finnmarkense genomovar finnmarkense]|uniref:hypothetical protein n=1 Tax=Tenacibaculum finnmarkense TaxID=2781243 RepID=UPI00187B76FA|nr:hypothetical protein [Tenacibaculum finnmarkense]MCD8436486.1 hypothetical protein [Tenacibaculum dicentrarchi]MBE7659661.1 hypothetical protein [Tenacibaculum finnmarkense genomovar finnmarkense]MCG8212311.1 hypothetical protein [Tenacibaculum finnmarkense genomovar finnmarkense]MCG8230625.1 hypothetical protein [Tenacibaculum finnmarkense genomovar finnmarkense]MCG8240933.1 hypothetical protein [Tenacibaculum finnmarkense genomovar finnmarkense]